MLPPIVLAALFLSTVGSAAGLEDFAAFEKAYEQAEDLYNDQLPLPQTFKGACAYPAFFHPRLYRPGQSITFFYHGAKHYLAISESSEFYGSVALQHTHGQMLGSYLRGPLARMDVVLKHLTRKEVDGSEKRYWVVQVPYVGPRNGHFYCIAEDTRAQAR